MTVALDRSDFKHYLLVFIWPTAETRAMNNYRTRGWRRASAYSRNFFRRAIPFGSRSRLSRVPFRSSSF